MTDDHGPLGPVDLAAATLYTRDLDAAIAWYADTLAWQPISQGSDGHPYAVFRIGSSIVVLEPIEAALDPAPPGSESTTINLVVKRDADEIRAELISRGVTSGEIVTSPGFRSFLIRDLDGNRYYVAQAR